MQPINPGAQDLVRAWFLSSPLYVFTASFIFSANLEPFLPTFQAQHWPTGQTSGQTVTLAFWWTQIPHEEPTQASTCWQGHVSLCSFGWPVWWLISIFSLMRSGITWEMGLWTYLVLIVLIDVAGGTVSWLGSWTMSMKKGDRGVACLHCSICVLSLDAMWPASLLFWPPCPPWLQPCPSPHDGLYPSGTENQNNPLFLRLLLSEYFFFSY